MLRRRQLESFSSRTVNAFVVLLKPSVFPERHRLLGTPRILRIPELLGCFALVENSKDICVYVCIHICMCVYTQQQHLPKSSKKARLIKFVSPYHLKVVPTQKTHCQQCSTRLRGKNIIPEIIVNTVESGPSIEARSEKNSYVTPP